MKQTIIAILCLLAGIAIGAGGLYAYDLKFDINKTAGSERPDPAAKNSVMAPFKVRAPITYDDGTLATYAVFKVQLVVKADAAEHAKAGEAMVINAINMRTFKTPMVKGPDGQIPDIEEFRRIATEAAAEALGKGVAANVLITDVSPDETGPID